MVGKLGFKRKRELLFHLFVLSLMWACSGTDTGNPITKGGYTDETETLATGVIRDSLGNPVPQCSVWVHPLSTGNPVSLAKVQFHADSTREPIVLVTDSSGVFDLIGIPTGTYSLIAVQKEMGIGIKTSFTIKERDTLQLLDTTTLLRVENLTIPLKALVGDTILIPELGLEWPVNSDTLRIRSIPKGDYTILNKSKGNAPVAILSTETISLGPLLQWNADRSQASFTDLRDNAIYTVITQANLVWMAENLRYQSTQSSCNPNDPYGSTSCAGYGRFYSWEEANTSCPPNWHLPTEIEWMGLLDYVGGTIYAGTALKSNSGWLTGNNGTDMVGFSVLPAGSESSPGLGAEAYFWTSSATNSIPTVINFSSGSSSAVVAGFPVADKLSVRCVSSMY